MRATLARCIEVSDIDIIRELTLTAARALISQSRPGWRPNKECRHFPSISSLWNVEMETAERKNGIFIIYKQVNLLIGLLESSSCTYFIKRRHRTYFYIIYSLIGNEKIHAKGFYFTRANRQQIRPVSSQYLQIPSTQSSRSSLSSLRSRSLTSSPVPPIKHLLSRTPSVEKETIWGEHYFQHLDISLWYKSLSLTFALKYIEIVLIKVIFPWRLLTRLVTDNWYVFHEAHKK